MAAAVECSAGADTQTGVAVVVVSRTIWAASQNGNFGNCVSTRSPEERRGPDGCGSCGHLAPDPRPTWWANGRKETRKNEDKTTKQDRMRNAARTHEKLGYDGCRPISAYPGLGLMWASSIGGSTRWEA